MTLIVTEGVDGSGKSTLIADIAHEYEDDDQVDILRRGPIQQHPMLEYVYPLVDYVPGGQTSLLLDRWHIGELIYGPLYRGASQVTPAQRMYIDMVLDRLGALKILMDPPLATVQSRLASRGEDFLKPQHQALVHDAYKEHCTALNGWITLTSPTRIKASDILESARRLEADAEGLDQFPTYVGPLKPRLLLLGDKRGPVVQGRPRYPWAFVPYRDTSGHFLFSALHMAGVTGVGVANACEELIYPLHEKLGKPPICVLGVQAAQRIEQVPSLKAYVTERVSHPQHVRRFQNGHMLQYGQQIKESIDG